MVSRTDDKVSLVVELMLRAPENKIINTEYTPRGREHCHQLITNQPCQFICHHEIFYAI